MVGAPTSSRARWIVGDSFVKNTFADDFDRLLVPPSRKKERAMERYCAGLLSRDALRLGFPFWSPGFV